MYLSWALDSKLEQIVQPAFLASKWGLKGEEYPKTASEHGWRSFWSKSLTGKPKLGLLVWVSVSLNWYVSSQVTVPVFFNQIFYSKKCFGSRTGRLACITTGTDEGQPDGNSLKDSSSQNIAVTLLAGSKNCRESLFLSLSSLPLLYIWYFCMPTVLSPTLTAL